MNKIIKSQDGHRLHYMPAGTPCFFNIAPVNADNAQEGVPPIYSVGINNVSFGIFMNLKKAEAALNALEDFLRGPDAPHGHTVIRAETFQIPADK